MPKDTQQIRLDLGPEKRWGEPGDKLRNKKMDKEIDCKKQRENSIDCIFNNNI